MAAHYVSASPLPSAGGLTWSPLARGPRGQDVQRTRPDFAHDVMEPDVSGSICDNGASEVMV